jgi:putative ABC transport system permease protein
MAIRESCQAARAGPPEIALGIAAELALTGRMMSLFLGVSEADPLTLRAVALLLTLVALTASYVAAWRALPVDPMEALRRE